MSRALVIGDIAIDWLEDSVPASDIRGDPGSIPNHRLAPGFRWTPRLGGAFLLERLLRVALAARKVDVQVLEQIPLDPLSREAAAFLHSLARIGPFTHLNGQALRVRSFEGFWIPLGGGRAAVLPLPDRVVPIDTLIIDDAANGCRWETDFVMGAFERAKAASLVILKLSRPLEGSRFLDLPAGKKRQVIVVINADDLRAQGVDISRCLSWERTAMDVIRASETSPVFQRMLELGQVLVRLDCDACVAVAESGNARLVFDPARTEGEFVARLAGGRMPGATSAFTAALAAELIAALRPAAPLEIVDALPAALRAARRLQSVGFATAIDGRPDYPTAIFEDNDGRFVTCDLPAKFADSWSILKDVLSHDPELPSRLVLEGRGSTLRAVPTARYEDLILADRREIEAYRSIENLFSEYLRSLGRRPKPLSIGVFGPPGAGKSFGVKQIAKAVGKGRIVSNTFNLTQLDDPRDLVGAFHVARDVGLRGDTPLLIFDEFDCDFEDRPYGWLKYFLAPMQDGEFKDQGRIHPLGRAIFVFSGGVFRKFRELEGLSYPVGEDVNESGRKQEGDLRQVQIDFRRAKGPDFVSRLGGHLDVLGINPISPQDGDPTCPVRRALLLRALLLDQHHRTSEMFPFVNGRRLFQIDRTVLEAFLSVRDYRHGARSLEALLSTCELVGRDRFAVTALPPDRQLLQHIDETFTSYLRRSG